MVDLTLADAVQNLASLTQGLPDSDLEREWAWGPYDSEGLRFAFFRTYEELRELAARTAYQRSAQGPALSTAQHILGQYHSAYRDLQAALLGVDKDTADLAPAEGQWPLRQVVAHVVGAEIGFTAVVRYSLARIRSGDRRPARMPDEAWESVYGEEIASLETMLNGSLVDIQTYYGGLHWQNLQQFALISESELETPSLYWEETEMSLRFRLHRFDSHLRQHIDQVDSTLDALAHRRNEARRLLRLIYSALAETEGAAIGAWNTGQELRHEAAVVLSARTEEIRSILE